MRPTPTPTHSPDGFAAPAAAPRRRAGPLRRHPPRLHASRTWRAWPVPSASATRWPSGRARGCGTCCRTEPFVPTLGALTGNQAVQQVKAGLKAIYLSGWQVAADANTAGQMYPDQSLYPVDSVPNVVRRINAALRRADQIATSGGRRTAPTGWRRSSPMPKPGSAAALNAYELMRAMIEAGAAGVHFEDQLASEKKCGHLGGKVLVPIASTSAP